MLTGVLTVGLGLLVVGGVWQLSRVDLGATRLRRKHLLTEPVAVPSREDLRRPERLLDDRAKFHNVVAMTMEVTIVAIAFATAWVVYTMPGVSPVLEFLFGAALVVGTLLVGVGLYIRSGLYRPDLAGPEDYRHSLGRRLDEGVAEEFGAVHGALSAARAGDGETDETLACVLAGARAGCSPDALVAWAETVGHDPESVRERVDRLSTADLVTVEDDRLRPGDTVADADPDQMATVAESVV